MKRVLWTLLLIAVLAAALLAPGARSSAQEPPPGCTPAMLAEKLAAIQDDITHAQALLSDNDTEGALAAFNAAAALMDEIRWWCSGPGPVSGGATEPLVITVEPATVEPVVAPASLCDRYPQYCVPLVGGPEVDGIPNEAPGLRPVVSGPPKVPHVVRGLTPEGAPFIGDPDAPIHFLEFLDFGCSHCAAYEEQGITPFIEQAVLSGQATFEVRLMRYVAGELSSNAAYAMLCAGEQGAAWEMYDALFAQYRLVQTQAYTTESISQVGNQLGLDSDALESCITSGRYEERLRGFNTSFNDLGRTGTPAMLVRYSASEDWTALADRSLDNLLALTAAANQ
jgi:protein-disulfide isomerase